MKLLQPTGSLLLLLALPGLAAWAQDAAPKPLAERLGYGRDAKLLIVHADDIGVAHSVNTASIRALGTGLVNSGSVMVPCPWFPEIAAYARAHPDLDLGLHLTLTSEWKHYRWDAVLPASRVPTLLDSLGFLYPEASDVAAHADPAEAEAEIRAQIERAMAFGLQPTHLDAHMGSLYQTPALFEAYLRVGRDYGLPVLLPRASLEQTPHLTALLRPDDLLIDRLVMASPDVPADAWDAFYTRAVETLEPGVTEIIVHLAFDDAEMQAVTVDHPDYGAAWRQRDFDFFTSPAFARLLEAHDVRLITWREIGRLLRE